ncbi:peptidyl-prolyl cis-trans isomerase D [Pseudoxanthomonas japonensis]|uniref:SurA N-terminal domain-containing protein n=1 Tax=Pseudoxanthomonas japonensis TaxID=69284 RepID=UPI0028605408|nr:SurA N-terminal domain-containing protein [Pseudoxanthomonas japonensis]MDR7067343.1 peptidyl-prolyl cis-trans isomerase D [Pseudoxanthomonas japonensis]
MLQKLRDKTSGWIASLILGLLIIPFAFVGVNEYVTGGTASDVALVEAPPTWWESAPQWWPVSTLWQREEVTQEDFRAAFEQARQQQRQALGEAFDPRDFESADNKRKVLDQLIDQKVLALGAKRAGIVVGDAAVQKMILGEPAFQVDGKFSPEQYQLLLSSQVPAISPLQFEEQQRDRLRMMLLPQAIGESDFVTDNEQARMWKLLGETRDIGIALLPPVAVDTAPVSDAQVKAWYDGHKNDFKQPERVSLEYLEINGATLPVTAAADEAALRKRYEAEKSRFMSPEQRVVAHILIAADAGADAATQKKAEEKAAALAKQAREGADFAALARANSEDPGSKDAGGELPAFAKDGSMVKPFEDAAFAMQAGEIRGPVKSDFGYHVLLLKQINAGTGRSFEEVRGELANEEASGERDRAFNELAGRVVNETLKNPTALAPAAEATGLPLQKIGPFSRDQPQGIAMVPAVLRAAFSDTLVQDGTISDPIEVAPNHSVVIRVSQHTPEQALPLDKARDAVVLAIRADRQEKVALAAADALIARVQKGESLAAISSADGLRFNELPGLRRGMPMPTAEANEAIFAAGRPAKGKVIAGKVALGDGAYAIFIVNKVVDGAIADMPAEERATMQQQLVQLNGGIATQAYVDAMRKRFKVKVFEERL